MRPDAALQLHGRRNPSLRQPARGCRQRAACRARFAGNFVVASSSIQLSPAAPTTTTPTTSSTPRGASQTPAPQLLRGQAPRRPRTARSQALVSERHAAKETYDGQQVHPTKKRKAGCSHSHIRQHDADRSDDAAPHGSIGEAGQPPTLTKASTGSKPTSRSPPSMPTAFRTTCRASETS